MALLIINDIDSKYLSPKEKSDLTKSIRKKRYYDRNIYIFDDENKDIAKEIFSHIKEATGENIKTLLVIGNPDDIIESFNIQYLFK